MGTPPVLANIIQARTNVIALRDQYQGGGRSLNARFGSSTEMAALAFDVGFTLNMRHSFDSSARQFRATRRHQTRLFDHFIGCCDK
jgi:hypothetical protein